MQTIIGHIKQREELATLAKTERLPSAIILSGTHGIGKKLVAHELARLLLCEQRATAPLGGCGTCRQCTLYNAGTHPDIHNLAFGGDRGANVDDIRLALEKMSLKAFMGGKKVAILDDADEISIVGANVLLKSLEEPRPDTFFILIVANPTRLPSTILSRCQRLFFDRLTPDEIRAIMQARGLPEATDALLLLADGSAASLDSLREQGEMWDSIREAIDKAWTGDAAAIAKAAQEWGADKTNLKDRLTFLRTTIRQKLLHSASDPSAAAVWANALQNVMDAEYLALDRHVNPTLTFLKTLQSCSQHLAHSYQVKPNSLPSIGEELLNGR